MKTYIIAFEDYDPITSGVDPTAGPTAIPAPTYPPLLPKPLFRTLPGSL
jgi:hypothetical protein